MLHTQESQVRISTLPTSDINFRMQCSKEGVAQNSEQYILRPEEREAKLKKVDQAAFINGDHLGSEKLG